ncbi:DUF2339 domain-containing protein [Lampropedia puyangensis]|nr:DUF2339 domain-containing protein [Lampropedia puyangensis]
MVIWGAIWGAFIGWLIGYGWELSSPLIGSVVGMLAGLTLRRSVRKEFARLQKDLQTSTRAQAQVVLDAARDPVEEEASRRDRRSEDRSVGGAADSAAITAGVLSVSTVASTPVRQEQDPASWHQAAAAAPLARSAQPVAANPFAPVAKPDAIAGQSTASPHSADSTAEFAPSLYSSPSWVERAFSKVRDWLTGGNTVAKVGGLMLFIGLAFLAKWAADNSMFPPEARLAGIAIVGIGLLVQGARMAKERFANAGVLDGDSGDTSYRFHYGILLQGLGVAILYLAIFAAFKLYGLLPSSAALALMVAVCVLSNVIALQRHAQAMAFVGFAGAFAAPVLLSDGSGNHVALFSYYLLLNMAIAGLAYLRPWRAVHLLGFLATFGVASAWGVLRYTPQLYASTQPFLLAFFVIYLVVGLLYALRHSAARAHKVDASLVFGLPVAALALQIELVRDTAYGAAWSSIIAGALYIGLAWGLHKRASEAAHWLGRSYAAIGLLLVTLAVPLAVEPQVTAAVWALEGAGIYWLSRQQNSRWGCAFGVLMQAVAGAMMLHVLDRRYYGLTYGLLDQPVSWPFANADFLSSLLLAGGALAISWWTRSDPWRFGSGKAQASREQHANAVVSVVLFVVGFGWAWQGLWAQLQYGSRPLFGLGMLHAVRILGFVALVLLAQWAAQRFAWRGARLPAYAAFPVVGFGILLAVVEASWGWREVLLWSVVAMGYLVVLYRADRSAPLLYWRVVHTANVGLALLLAGRTLAALVDWARLWRSDWYAVVGVVSAIAVLLLLSRAVWWRAQRSQNAKSAGWPLNRFRRDYLLHAGAGVAALVGLSTLALACLVRGDVQPLPYVPLLNPIDLAALLGLGALVLWRLRVEQADWIDAESAWKSRMGWAVIAVLGFVVVNTVWLRVAHHFFAVPWRADTLAQSFVVQAGYSVLWTVLALMTMVLARRRAQRVLWQVGAGLLGLTVVKMLLVDLANSGGGERIVAFIAVGALMVAIGYFAPMPAARTAVVAQGKESS